MLPQPFPKQPRIPTLHRLGRCGPAACLVLLLGAELTTLRAQQASVAAMSQNEVRRRAMVINKAGEEIQRGYLLIEERKAEEALALFSAAYEAIPDVPMAQEHRAAARNGYLSAGCLHVQDLAARGDLEAADRLLEQLLAVAPNDARALALKKRLADPDRFPPALTAKHVGNVEAVHALLIKASSFLELGDPDKAISTYQEVLRIDPHNGAARRGMESAETFKSKYYQSARDHQRAQALAKVDATWEDPVPQTVDVSAMFGAANAAANRGTSSGRDEIVQKLRTLTVPQIELSGVTLEEATELLRVRSRDLDPAGRGVSFIINVPPEVRNKPISLTLFNVPLEEVLRYVSETVGVSYKVEEHAVVFVSVSDRGSAIIGRSFRVPPDFIQNSPVNTPPAAAGGADPFAGQAPAGGALVVRRMGAKEFLEGRGVSFPEGTSASFNNATSTLTVRNTVENMEMIELLVEQATKSAPKMAVIQVKMIEINQTNLEELGFDSLLGGVSASSNVFLGGGTAGNGTPSSAANYPFATTYTTQALTSTNPNTGVVFDAFPAIPVNGALAGPLPPGTTAPFPYGGGPISSGLRSGSYAVSQNSLDSLLKTGSANNSAQVAPGVLSVAGVFTDPQFQSVMRALSQKKGVDVNASPSVTTKNGIKASVEITREIIYPTEFDPPQLPQNGNTLVINLTGGGGSPPIATPTTPTAFETRKTGVLVDVEPIISEDGRSVELTITPELTDFEGFVNYGSPIYSPSSQTVQPIQLGPVASLVGGNTSYIPISSPEQLITPNLILQPVFKTQKVVTAVKVWDGATVVLGGAKVQERQIVNDKIPIVGDLPFVGRFFRSDANQTTTKNVIIFVTVNVVDPSGAKVNRDTAAAGTSSSAAAELTQ